MHQPLNCIIADDNDIDRLTTQSFVKRIPHLHIAGVYSDAESAIAEIEQLKPDIAFLDIDMPGISGIELRKQFLDIPACIFISAYPDYAVESFELAALDFIVKPINAQRFAKTTDRIHDFFTIREKAKLLDHSLGADSITIKEGHSYTSILIHQVQYLEALKDYTRIVTTTSKHYVLASIGNLLKEAGFGSFIRIHKSYAVQKLYITKIKAQEVLLQNTTLPVGRIYKDALKVLKQSS